jgi:hypothetical protein
MNITETTIEVCYVLAITRFICKNYISYPVPYMNQNLRNAIYKKKMYHNKFLKQKTDKNWETYRKQRNLVTKLRKTSFIYFDVLISYIFGYIHKKVVKYFSHLLWIIYNKKKIINFLNKKLIKIGKHKENKGTL